MGGLAVCAACGPTVDGDEDDDVGDASSVEDSTGVDPSATDSATSESASGTSGSSASASASEGESGEPETTASDTGSASVDEGEPPPPEGGEIGEGGDCSCCRSSLRVVLGGDASEFAITLSSPSFREFTVTCPAETAVGLSDDIGIVCGVGDLRLVGVEFGAEFVEETWTIGGSPTLQADSTCAYEICDCNCVPVDCELAIPPDLGED